MDFALPAALQRTLALAGRLAAPAQRIDPAPRAPRRALVEKLEPRQLLTTLVGGDTFEFSYTGGLAVRVALTGNIQAELIGATLDARNQPQLNQVPGALTGGPRQGTKLFGGYAGADGISPINVAFPPETESRTNLTGLGFNRFAPSTQINLRALAVNSEGKTYAINSFAQTFGMSSTASYQLVSVNRANGDGTVVAQLADDVATQLGVNTGALGPVTAAAFSPDDPNLLYFLASARIGGGVGADGMTMNDGSVQPFLFTYDLQALTDPVRLVDGNFSSAPMNETQVYGITFNEQGQLLAFLRFAGQDDPQTGPPVGLATINVAGRGGSTNNISQFQKVNFQGATLDAVSAIATIPGRPDFVYAVANGGGVIPAGGMGGGGNGGGGGGGGGMGAAELFGDANLDAGAGDGARLIRIDLGSSDNLGRRIAEDLGNLPDPDQNGAMFRRGENLIGLAWHPKVPNPFRLTDNDPTNDVGSLIATDIATDELVVLDDRPRFPTTGLYNIAITDSDTSGKISIAEVPVPGTPGPRPMMPFTGDAGPITVTNATTGRPINITPVADSGALLLGLKRPGAGGRLDLVGQVPYSTFTNAGGLVNDLRVPAMLEPGVISNGSVGGVMFGGTVTGRVNIQGALGTFYAGQIFTGDLGGIGATDPVTAVDNFAVRGDLRDLFSFGSLGTIDDDLGAPTFRSGFQLAVGGRVGQVVSRGSILGTAGVLGSQRVQNIGDGEAELETRQQGLTPGAAFEGFLLSEGRFSNDTFDTPQYVNSFVSRGRGYGEQAQVFGNLDGRVGDGVDYWAMPLLAGQQVEVEHITASITPTYLGIFDPTGRLVATDYGFSHDAPFQFTPTMPGTYRFAVGFGGDTTFAGGASNNTGSYELRLSRIANVSLGGLVATGDIKNPDAVPLRVFNGDFGAVAAGGQFEAGLLEVDHGNLRSVNGAEIGRSTEGTPAAGPTLYVPRGAVGLLRTTDPAGRLAVNAGSTSNGIVVPLMLPDGTTVDPAAGDDYQMVDGAGSVLGSFVTNAGIGEVRGGSIIGGAPTIETAFVADADQRGSDGMIDLIDSGGSLGTANTGGPIITHGPGGNVRYIRAAGTPFRDPIFGRGNPEQTTFRPGESARLTDDSGATLRLTPTFSTFPVAGSVPSLGETLTVTTYPIRSGGQVVLDVTSSGGLDASESGAAAELGQVTLNGGGTAVVSDAFPNPNPPIGLPPDRFAVLDNVVGLPVNTSGTAAPSLNANFSGNGRLDVLRLVGGNFDRINNSTPGELVTVQANSINRLSGRTLGMANGVATPARPEPLALLGTGPISNLNAFPFLNTTTGIITGNIAEADARAGVGNFVVNGDLGQLRADSDGTDDPALWDGIAGPIFSTGTIRRVQIGGQGIAPSGTGNRSEAGLYANGLIGDVTNSGVGSDVYGNIVSGSGIRSVRLTDGVINGAEIDVSATLADTRVFAPMITSPSLSDPITDPQADIREIRLDGIGGIIGSAVYTQDIGPVSVNGGFGILGSSFNGFGDGVQRPITTDGLGIRGTDIVGGAIVQRLTANGDGNLLNTNAYAPSARQTGLVRADATTGNAFDPVTGQLLTAANDIQVYTGVTRRRPRQSGKTNAGVIENTTVTASRDLNEVSAYQIQDNQDAPFFGPTGRTGAITTRFTLGNSVKKVIVRGAIVGLEVTSGGVGQFNVGRGIFNTDFAIGGRLDSLTAGGTVHSDSIFRVFGPDGQIGKIAANQGFFAPVSASVGIDEFRIGGDLLSKQLGSSPFSGGPVKLLSVGGSVLTGTDLRILGSLRTLFIGGDVERGAFIRAGAIGKQTVGGTVAGLITTV